MKKTIIFIVILLSFSSIMKSQESEYPGMFVKTGFIIISASKNYDAAKKSAEQASKKLKYKLDLRGLQYNSEIGLSMSKEECEGAGFEFPTNVQRGRENENLFVSVEYTDMYKGFSKGLYIVVVATYPKNDANLKPTLNYVKKYFKHAYIKYADIYLGCIH